MPSTSKDSIKLGDAVEHGDNFDTGDKAEMKLCTPGAAAKLNSTAAASRGLSLGRASQPKFGEDVLCFAGEECEG